MALEGAASWKSCCPVISIFFQAGRRQLSFWSGIRGKTFWSRTHEAYNPLLWA